MQKRKNLKRRQAGLVETILILAGKFRWFSVVSMIDIIYKCDIVHPPPPSVGLSLVMWFW